MDGGCRDASARPQSLSSDTARRTEPSAPLRGSDCSGGRSRLAALLARVPSVGVGVSAARCPARLASPRRPSRAEGTLLRSDSLRVTSGRDGEAEPEVRHGSDQLSGGGTKTPNTQFCASLITQNVTFYGLRAATRAIFTRALNSTSTWQNLVL